MEKVIDPKVMTEFSENLNSFGKSMVDAHSEIEDLLRKPGIESSNITQEIHDLKTKLLDIGNKWNELSSQFHKNLNISIDEANKLQMKLTDTLSTR